VFEFVKFKDFLVPHVLRNKFILKVLIYVGVSDW
jgi:hypothetical protein